MPDTDRNAVRPQSSALPDIDDVRLLDEADRAVLAELRAVLERHGSLERFGVTLLHQHFDLADDEILVETTDRTARRQTISPAPAVDAGDTIKAAWHFLAGRDGMSAMMRCIMACVRVGTMHLDRHRN